MPCLTLSMPWIARWHAARSPTSPTTTSTLLGRPNADPSPGLLRDSTVTGYPRSSSFRTSTRPTLHCTPSSACVDSPVHHGRPLAALRPWRAHLPASGAGHEDPGNSRLRSFKLPIVGCHARKLVFQIQRICQRRAELLELQPYVIEDLPEERDRRSPRPAACALLLPHAGHIARHAWMQGITRCCTMCVGRHLDLLPIEMGLKSSIPTCFSAFCRLLRLRRRAGAGRSPPPPPPLSTSGRGPASASAGAPAAGGIRLPFSADAFASPSRPPLPRACGGGGAGRRRARKAARQWQAGNPGAGPVPSPALARRRMLSTTNPSLPRQGRRWRHGHARWAMGGAACAAPCAGARGGGAGSAIAAAERGSGGRWGAAPGSWGKAPRTSQCFPFRFLSGELVLARTFFPKIPPPPPPGGGAGPWRPGPATSPASHPPGRTCRPPHPQRRGGVLPGQKGLRTTFRPVTNGCWTEGRKGMRNGKCLSRRQ